MCVCFRAPSDPLAVPQTARRATAALLLADSSPATFHFLVRICVNALRHRDNGALLCVDVEVVRGPRVFVVMDGCGKERRHHLELRQPVLSRHTRQRDLSALGTRSRAQQHCVDRPVPVARLEPLAGPSCRLKVEGFHCLLVQRSEILSSKAWFLLLRSSSTVMVQNPSRLGTADTLFRHSGALVASLHRFISFFYYLMATEL